MLKAFRDDKASFKLLIEKAIRSWNDTELNFLAESLVQFFLIDPESEVPQEPLLERLEDIIDIDIKIWKEEKSIYDIAHNSFSSKIFTQIVMEPQTRHYIQKTLSKLYEEIDYDMIHKLDLQEAHKLLSRRENLGEVSRTFMPDSAGGDEEFQIQVNQTRLTEKDGGNFPTNRMQDMFSPMESDEAHSEFVEYRDKNRKLINSEGPSETDLFVPPSSLPTEEEIKMRTNTIDEPHEEFKIQEFQDLTKTPVV